MPKKKVKKAHSKKGGKKPAIGLAKGKPRRKKLIKKTKKVVKKRVAKKKVVKKKVASSATRRRGGKAKKKIIRQKGGKKAKKKTTKKVKKVVVGPRIKVIAGKSINLDKEKPVGEIIHYYGKIKVGVIEIHKGHEIRTGEILYYSGHTTDFHDVLSSMQEFGKQIAVAKGKMQVGIKVSKKVRQGDKVFKITKI